MEHNRFYNIELADDPTGKKRVKDIIDTVTDPATGISHTTVTHETRYDHAAQFLCDDCAARPHRCPGSARRP